ncbi:hypothetical protein EGH24_05025 [Halonotius terrestris]|uniref:Uncharacterized protein n=1 Tax=Halonotius terrestris TaxID=2487750 RepID=A0A8J8P8F2_9EURY|nr:hypothetical protein [Halonotius terrestris]TQQ82805.1 hypothetical protein EGH24_05025 [Halonotius terrestris]
MAETTTATGAQAFSTPENSAGYLAVLTALITGILHLYLIPGALQAAGTTGGVLFALNGIGFVGGTLIYLSKYWRKELFLVAALYALASILAMFMVHGWGVEAFYRDGSLAHWAIITKSAESILLGCSLYLFSNS